MMNKSGEFFPPVWIMGQTWKVEYFFEQKLFNLALDVASVIPQNFVSSSEVWEYQVYGRENLEGRPHIVVRITPSDGVSDEMKASEFQVYFEEQTRTLHGFKRKVVGGLGEPRIEYVKNPWGAQSFFMADHEHLILDWPQVEDGRVEKNVGMGRLAFFQRDFFDRSGFVLELGNGSTTTVMNWQQNRPWWVFADKVVALPDRAIHIQAKLVESSPEQASLLGGGGEE